MKIYLASASPRRRELLAQIGLQFEVKVSNVQEKVTASDPEKVVEELSEQKARAVFEELAAGTESGRAGRDDPETDNQVGGEALLVIGADTVVAADGRILGKPADREAAVEMLELLSGRTHEVFTGVTLICRNACGQVFRKTFHERTEVSFYAMTGREIEDYAATGDCMDKAGAYGIQGLCARYIREIKGDYNNVVGLPAGRLYQEAKEWLED